jgi:N-succinyl-L-ornithine transcarbamylase
LAWRAFAQFESKEFDSQETIINQFIQYQGNLFSVWRSYNTSFTGFSDLITIEEYKETPRPKVVLTWAPHPNALPTGCPQFVLPTL